MLSIHNSLRKLGRLSKGIPNLSCGFFFAAAMIGTALSVPARAQINFNTPIQLVDNDANQGSPTLVEFNGSVALYYVNHSNNTIYVDIGLTGNPQSTGIVVNSAELTDVGAVVLNGDVLISYVSSAGNVTFALSSNGVSFSSGVIPTGSSLGLPGGVSPNTAFIPAMVNDAGTVYVATVSAANNEIYMSKTTNGTTFTPLNSPTQPVDGNPTTSRPSMTLWQGNPWLAFTSGSSRVAIVGNVLVPSSFDQATLSSWGNSNRNSNYAGICLLNYGNTDLYIFGQSTASSQQLLYTVNSGGGWSTPAQVGNQMRWTPTLILTSGQVVVLAYQDDGNTNISYRSN